MAGEGISPFGVAGEKFNVVSVRREESISFRLAHAKNRTANLDRNSLVESLAAFDRLGVQSDHSSLVRSPPARVIPPYVASCIAAV